MIEMLDFFPFNMTSGPAFLVFYLLLCVGGVLATWATAAWVARRAEQPQIGAGPVHGTHAYRAPGATPRQRLTIGSLPQPDEIWAVAWLRGQVSVTAEALVAAAIAEGGVVIDPSSRAITVVREGHSDPLLDAFYRGLRARTLEVPGDVLAVGKAVAASAGPALRGELMAAGLVRSPRALSAMLRVIWTGGVLLLAIGFVRAVRGVALDRPVGLLVLEMLALGAVLVGLSLLAEVSPQRRKYLRWLSDATGSVCAEVAERRRTEPTEVALAVAQGGVASLMMLSTLFGSSSAHGSPIQSSSHTCASSTNSSCGGSGSGSGASSCGSGSSGGGSSCGSGSGGGGSSCGSGSGGGGNTCGG
ncbi:MAG: hypothetical protein WKG00_11710 [Polyangiaceae bacterium]